MLITTIILVKDGAHEIGGTLEEMARQSLYQRSDLRFDVLVVANGCTDNTAEVARGYAGLFAAMPNAALRVIDVAEPGKSRSWNRAVHEFAAQDSDYLLFIDADIEFSGPDVLAGMLDFLIANADVRVCSGYAMKHLHKKEHKTLLERISLAISRETRYTNAIAGSLYLIRGQAVRSIWLPLQTPGEDGFLAAMVTTEGFSTPARPEWIRETVTPSHYFEAVPLSDFLSHERRLLVGTMVNRWVFEHLWSLQLTSPGGPLIDQMNREDPNWTQKIIDRNTRGKGWVIPNALTFRRFKRPSQVGLIGSILRLPLSLIGTALTLPAASMANQRLKRAGAAGTW